MYCVLCALVRVFSSVCTEKARDVPCGPYVNIARHTVPSSFLLDCRYRPPLSLSLSLSLTLAPVRGEREAMYKAAKELASTVYAVRHSARTRALPARSARTNWQPWRANRSGDSPTCVADAGASWPLRALGSPIARLAKTPRGEAASLALATAYGCYVHCTICTLLASTREREREREKERHIRPNTYVKIQTRTCSNTMEWS